ncbi:hypothetical protein [Mangrovibacterium lignilyticum]|uniref:hypothetical protein n=1 Tax=Mangrovibacterium lignilyticum TaxID=2668052 RepID=UPI0013D3AD0A|nr:hypothetical protein [Mangrovibacterium lignilyticum]
MTKIIRTSSSLCLIFIILACTTTEKTETLKLQGIYTGIFSVEYTNGEVYSNPVTMTFNGQSFTCSSGSDWIPAGGSGTFHIDGSKIIFTDENMWTANFDWNLILTGDYDLHFNHDEIEISAMKNNIGLYQYKLKKKTN